MNLFLVVDGGQSSTMAVIGLGLEHDGPSNHVKSAGKGGEAISEEAKP